MRTTVLAGTTVDAAELDTLAAKYSVRVGDRVRQGGLAEPAQEWVGDGVLRWSDRKTEGGILRWRRPCTSGGELADLEARLVAVDDADAGWLRLEEIKA